MGLFNVIKLANDYNKAKKYLKTRKKDLEMVKDLIEKVKIFLMCVTDIKDKTIELINKVQITIKELEKEVKGGK